MASNDALIGAMTLEEAEHVLHVGPTPCTGAFAEIRAAVAAHYAAFLDLDPPLMDHTNHTHRPFEMCEVERDRHFQAAKALGSWLERLERGGRNPDAAV